MAVDFPSGIPNIPSANGANPLSTTHGAGVSQAAGTNRILTNLVALANKLGVGAGNPTARKLLAGGATAGTTAWADFPGTTLFVAASNASAQARALANYVCDGADDQAEIIAAINALPATVRGRVLLSEGTFNIGGQINIATANLTIEGMGRGATTLSILQGSGGAAAINGAILVLNGQFCVARNFGMDGRKSVNTGATGMILLYGTGYGGVVENVYLVNSGGTTGGVGLYLDGNSSGWTLDKVQASACSSHGIQAANVGSYGHRIVNCVANSNGGTGIWAQTGARTQVIGCLAQSNGSNGLEANGSIHFIFANNVAYGNNGQGIYMGGCANAQVIGNLSQLNGTTGISINNSRDSLVVGNYVDSCSTSIQQGYNGIDFISCDNVSVHSNTVRRGTGANRHAYGISVAGTNHLVGLNDLYDSGNIAPFYDGGTNTRRVAKLQMDYNPTNDLLVNAVFSGGSPQNVCANQTFRVNSAHSVIAIVITGGMYGQASGGIQLAGQVYVDDAAQVIYSGFSTSAGTQFQVPLSTTLIRENLAIGNHTVRVAMFSTGTWNAWLRPSSNPSYEDLRIQVMEYER